MIRNGQQHVGFWIKMLIFTFIFIFSSAQAEPGDDHYNPIAQGLRYLTKNIKPGIHFGIIVQSMNTGRIYYSKNAHQFFLPASVQKIFTVTTALVNLGPTYHFPTRLLTDGSIHNGVLHGDLIFQFNGDPSLTQNNLSEFTKKLQSMGVRRIIGNVIIDDFAFAHIPYPPGWQWKDLSYDFAAPLNTVIINRNQFGLSFMPAPRAGERGILIPQLPPNTANFINQTVTTNYSRGSCPMSIFSNERNQYLIRGCIPRRMGKQSRSLAIRDIQLFTKGLIRELLAKHGISYRGVIYIAKTPAGATVLDEHDSTSLSHLIIHLLKKSDNLYADALLKKSGERFTRQPGSWENGLLAVRSTISQDAGINLNSVHLVDGSGLSQYDQITPASLSQLLNYIDHQPMLRNSLIPALPIAGVDGTLIWRMPTLARNHLVHAKTGSMTGVSSLAGFVKTRTHGILSFVIMINNIPQYRAPYILLENHICEFLARS
ncbi:MAG: hypothetical protein ACD_42C00226G0003 [uncultured bacterium]|nr:MAG: hypothetical protein ACD_42C00226G0003 [uncultured bacterium]OGT49956.1 MAG: D-alanyl-D-alanine carboxypeptidase/D-alanyl-D-alanine-endopeptidase [Gammaproteobacteria bacterium RIFCSPHIGHO2_12_FULL_39_24]